MVQHSQETYSISRSKTKSFSELYAEFHHVEWTIPAGVLPRLLLHFADGTVQHFETPRSGVRRRGTHLELSCFVTFTLVV